jgi:hypothetical protein
MESPRVGKWPGVILATRPGTGLDRRQLRRDVAQATLVR